MKIRIIAVGKNKDAWVDEAVNEYSKRLSKFCDLSFEIVQEEKITSADAEKLKEKEGERILSRLKDDYVTIALDVLGNQLSSQDFSKLLVKSRDFDGGKIQFIIGGALGLSGAVLARSRMRLSFSKMTLTHQMIRVLLLEQIYRGFEIERGSEYHK